MVLLKTSSIQLKSGENNDTARKVYTEKAIKNSIDPKLETADIDVTNNTWPKEIVKVLIKDKIKKRLFRVFFFIKFKSQGF
jgi:hypothetical protein